MARLPVFYSQANISATSPVQPIENPMYGEVNKMAKVGQELAVRWQQTQNAAETLDGKNKLETAMTGLLKEAQEFSDYKTPKELEQKQTELLEQNNKVIDEVAGGFTNNINATNFKRQFQIDAMHNQERIKAAFRQKTGDLARANGAISYEHNKDNFVLTGDPSYKQNYLNDLELSKDFYSREEMAKMKLKVEDWDYDYAINEATKDPEGTLANLGRFGLNADQTYDVEKRANAVLARKKAQLKKGRTEEEAAEIAEKQTSNAIVVENELANIKELKKEAPVERVLHNLELQENIQNMGTDGLSESDYKKYRKEAVIDLMQAVKNDADTFDDAWIRESAMSVGLQAMKNDGKIAGKAWSEDMSVVMIRDFYAMAKEKGLDLRANDSNSRDAAKKLASKAISNTIERVSGGYGKEFNSVFLNGQKVSKNTIKTENTNYTNPDYIIENGKKIYNETGIEVELDQ